MGTGVISNLSIASSPVEAAVKKLLFKQLDVDTVTALGTNQATATALTAGKNMVLAADGTVGVALPPAVEGMTVHVVNTVSNQTLKGYAANPDTINAAATGDAFSITAGGTSTFHCDVRGHWYAAVSNATGTATAASTAELDVLDGALATNLVAAKAAITTTNGGLTLGGSVTAVGSFIIGAADMSEADLEKLDGITNGAQAANKAVVADANVNTGVSKVTQLWVGATGAEVQVSATPAELNTLAAANAVLATQAGAGFTDGAGAIYKSSVQKLGGIFKSNILLDLTGVSSSTTDLDIIGTGASAAYIGQITAARSGTILSGRMTCLEAPVGGVTDIDLYSATESTGVFDAGIATLIETALVTAGGAWTVGLVKIFTGIPAANEYLYLTGGAAGTAAAYTAGKFLIEIDGY